MDLGLAERVAVVTGGASGIGRAIAAALIAEGARVYLLDVAEPAELPAGMAGMVHADVREPAAVAAALARVAQAEGGLDVLVNSAGVLGSGGFAEADLAQWRRIEGVNLTGVVVCCQAAIPHLGARRRGRIVNIASVAAFRGGGAVGNVLYGASKAGVVALTLGLARELGPAGITVNAIAPGITPTAMTAAHLGVRRAAAIARRVPLGRLARAEDTAAVAAFLASDRAGFISGTVIPVDGGWLAA